ncbi:MAG: TPM domain-containing protein [Gammaproteobacteria bacterium]|nr:TPM domain-containing protein [Gammaproteobacteria bacterium]
MQKLSSVEKEAISNATREAERRSYGEIVTVIAASSDAYHAVTLLWSTLVSLLVPAIFLMLDRLHLVTRTDISTVYNTQLIVFILLLMLLRIPSILRAILPATLRQLQVRRAAQMQFYTHQLQHTRHRCGILLYVSVLERRVELLADQGINDRVPPATWKTITDNFITRVRREEIKQGFVQAIEACGAVLAQHFPAEGANTNELADEVLEKN